MQKYHRYMKDFGLSSYEAEIMVTDADLARYFDELIKHNTSKTAVNWLLRDVLGWIKEAKIAIQDCSVTQKKLGQLVSCLKMEL